MNVSTHPSAPRPPQHLLAALIVLLCAIPVARADEVPVLRQGLWDYQRTAGTQKFAATECIDPSEDLFAVFMMQGPGQREHIRSMVRNLVYASLE